MPFFSQDKLQRADKHENHTLRRLKAPCGSGEPEAMRLNAKVDHTALGDCDEDLLRRFSELADKYWNGPTTLLKNQQSRSQHHIVVSLVTLVVIVKISYRCHTGDIIAAAVLTYERIMCQIEAGVYNCMTVWVLGLQSELGLVLAIGLGCIYVEFYAVVFSTAISH